jgi:type II secretory pathway pseudopilin PulG
MKHFFQEQKGYTLAEAIVAIGILSSALLGTLVLAAQSINVTDIAQTKTQAEFLAEEGIELTRAFRDATAAKFVFFDPASPCDGSCQAANYHTDIVDAHLLNEGDHVDLNLDSKSRVCVDAAKCYSLFINPLKDSRYVLREGANNSTRFKRIITLTKKKDSSGSFFVEVRSQVDYVTRGTNTNSSYQLVTDLYD